MDVLRAGPEPGLAWHHSCDHGEFPDGTSCRLCVRTAERRARAGVNDRWAMTPWALTAGGPGELPTVSKYCARWEDGEGGSAADVVRLYGPEEIREELAISHSSGVWLRCLAFDADLWFSCLHRRREEGTTHSPELDALLDSLRVTTHT